MTEVLRRPTPWVHHALMRVGRAAGVWLLAWCGPLLLAAFVALLATPVRLPHEDVHNLENVYPNIVFGAVVPLLGALVLTRLPRHPIGLLFLACGLASAVTLTIYVYAWLALQQGLPGGAVAAWVSEWVWGLGLIPLVTIGVLLFPEGRPPGRRWGLLLVGDLAAIVLVFLANAFHPGPLENHPVLDNPVGIPLPHAVFGALGATGMALFLVGVVGGATAAVVRWRHGDVAERAQLGWFAFTVALLALVIAVPTVLPTPRLLDDVVMLVAIPLLPASVAVAILRRNLYGIEVIVHRSLAYAALSVVLLLGYALAVSGSEALFQGRASQAATLTGTALVAVAFAPVRDRMQRAVDRLLYGDRGDPYAVLTGLGRHLEEPTGTRDPLLEVAATVARSLRLPYVRVEVAGAERPAAVVVEQGEPTDGLHEVPLTYRGDHVGRMLVAPRTPQDPFRAADLRLLEDLGRQIGVAVHAMRLAADLQRSRERLVATREEERRRMRRDLHDGLGPTLAGVALGLDAVRRTAAGDPAGTETLAEQLKNEVQGALADVRRLVEDLRPPALDQLGLVGAIRQHAQRLTDRDPGLRVTVDATGVSALPAAVEVAAYRITTEALTNVARHAAARRCHVGLRLNGTGVLEVAVEDDGVGLPATPRAGVGLAAMRERAAELGGSLEAGPALPGGTRVGAWLPVVTR